LWVEVALEVGLEVEVVVHVLVVLCLVWSGVIGEAFWLALGSRAGH